ncbi:MAG: ABC transporter transmembrane domain-containing protein, partial [Candidatus Eiseniibacteriota bacterium]
MTDHELLEDEPDPGGLDVALWRRVLAHAWPYRRPLLGLTLSGIVAAATDVLMPLVTGRIIDSATLEADRQSLLMNVVIYLALVATLSVVIWYFIVAAGKAATGFAHDLRRAAFGRLQELSFSFFDRRPVGWLMARLTSDCARLSSLLPWMLLDCTWGSFLLAGIGVVMLVLDWKLALMVMAIIPPLAVTSVIFQRRLLRTQRLVRKTNSRLTASYNEGIMGTRTTKTLVREDESLEEFQQLSGLMYGQSVRNALLAAVYLPIVLTLGAIGVGLALWRGGLAVLAGGGGAVGGAVHEVATAAGAALAGAGVGEGMSLGTLIAFMQYAALFYIPVQEMAARFTELQAAQASAERLQGLLDTEPAIRDSAAVRERLRRFAAGHGAADGDLAPDGHAMRIATVEFDGVSFAYGEESVAVLSDLDLRVEAGDTVALVGATGSGKTTIVSLLCRFYEPTRGTIRLNGIDYRERSLAWLQSQLGIVLQAPHLFSGTIRDNIRYGRLEASDAEVEE